MKSQLTLLNIICRVAACLLLISGSGCRIIRVPPANAVDVRTVLLPLTPAGVNDRSSEFANVFCSVMQAEFQPDWGRCGQYIDRADTFQPVPLPSLPADFRLVIIAGLLSSCSGQFAVFEEGIKHLHEVHHIEVTTPRVDGFGSTVNNAQQILTHLNSLVQQDNRWIVLLGYSKGATDIQQALVMASPQVKSRIAAFITLSGMIGGSRLYDILGANPDKLLKSISLGSCGSDSGGLAELSRAKRQEFLRDHPGPIVPSYSFAAVSTKENTSKVLQPTWKYLSAYGQEQDSQMLFPEQIVPGGTFLGTARADHWAVAIPFEQDPEMRSKVDRNHYPRAVLLESLFRFAVFHQGSTPNP
jgi:hypothetical protein